MPPPVDKAPELNVVTVGTFKGVLTVGNEVETKLRKDTINQLITSIHQDIKNIYNLDLNSTGKSFQFDTEQLNPDKIESYEKMQKSLNELHGLLRESGLGKLNLDKAISTFLYEVQLAKKLKMQFQCKTKVYILDGFNFSSRDYFSKADAFLIVRSGQVEYNERQNYQINTDCPQFHKCFEFTSDLPGSYVIEIHAYDYDDFFGDSLIGSTYIDVDDRFFSQGWQSLTKKPIEYRELRIPTSGLPQGVVKLWCEINETTSQAANLAPMDITPEPVKEFQLQVTVWKCVDIEPMDFEGASDVYCRAFFDPAQDKFTDTHWRVFDGKCSFNWRLMIPVKSKQKEYQLTLQAWDRDIISSNVLLGEFVVDIGPLVNDVLLTGKQMNMSLEYWQTWMKDQLIEKGNKSADEIKFETREKEEEKYWIPLRRMNTKEGKMIESGEMQVTIHLVPLDHVEKFPQGEGRESPNSEPFCPEPEGRIQLSINPFAMFQQLVPPALRRKICYAICCLICLALCVYMGPQIFSNLITYAITQIFPK